MTSITRPIKTWVGNISTRCVFNEILNYWKAYDVITFLVDLGIYHPSLFNFLDDREKKQEQELKSDYFKKRFTISRSILKHILLNICETEKISDINLVKKKNGRIVVKGKQDICISLSYSGTCIALSVGKRKIGSDIEEIRPVSIKKIRSSPLFNHMNYRNEKERIRHFLHVWTLIEAYAKLHDKNPYPYLNYKFLPEEGHFVSYCINQRLILSLAFSSDQLKDIVLWLDPECSETLFSVIKNAAWSSNFTEENTHVRA
jgi:4'-phosphopantetheinyl transferase